MNRLDAVFFDMDGLMLDTERIYRRAWQQGARELGYELDDSVFLKFFGIPTRDCEQMLGEMLGPVFPLAEFKQRWPRAWRTDVTENGIPIKPGLFELLGKLEACGVPKAVVTSTVADDARYTLQLVGIDQRFVSITSGDQVMHGKPAPDIYRLAAQRLGVAPGRSLVFEDSEAGVRAGAAAGMRVIMVPDIVQPGADVRELAYRVLPTLGDALPVIAPWLPPGNGNG